MFRYWTLFNIVSYFKIRNSFDQAKPYLPVAGEAAAVATVGLGTTISSNILGASFRKYSLRFGPLISYQQFVFFCFPFLMCSYSRKDVERVYSLTIIHVYLYACWQSQTVNCHRRIWRISIVWTCKPEIFERFFFYKFFIFGFLSLFWRNVFIKHRNFEINA